MFAFGSQVPDVRGQQRNGVDDHLVYVCEGSYFLGMTTVLRTFSPNPYWALGPPDWLTVINLRSVPVDQEPHSGYLQPSFLLGQRGEPAHGPETRTDTSA